MKKIVVFGTGWGGSLFADYLEEKVGVLDVVREIDWCGGECYGRGKRFVRERVEKLLGKYIGKVDLIVLASYEVSQMVLVYLCERYPEQKFVGFIPRLVERLKPSSEDELMREMVEYKKQLSLKQKIKFACIRYDWKSIKESILKLTTDSRGGAVLILACDAVKKSKAYQREKRNLAGKYRVLEPNCERWMREIDTGGEEVNDELPDNLPVPGGVKIVIMYGTTFMKKRELLAKTYGWKVKIYDDFERTAKDACRLLDIRGRTM